MIKQRLTGELDLRIERRAGKDIATSQYHQGALRVLRPHYLDNTAQVCYTVVNPGGGYLGADRYRIGIDVGEQASLLLTTQSATKIYRTPQGEAQSQLNIELGAYAVLEYLPDQLIAYRDASYRQKTVVRMQDSSSLVLCEIITPGWSPDGQPFKYHRIRMRTEVYVDGNLMVLDNLLVEPQDQDVESLLYLQGFTHVGMLLAVDSRIETTMVEGLREDAYAVAAQQDEPVHVGISMTATSGLSVRTLGTSTESASTVLLCIVNSLRQRLRAQEPVELRKY
ncbi:urease accessory protein UreD [Glutamicibacter ectropisis]|uniref:Urease accessory protein UreD n=1 Tax=Glutamicibacter ectropisis TaxID=3046593 RepID=A0AAU6WAG4_9MICC